MRKLFLIATFCATATVGSIAAAGEIHIQNSTGEDIRIKCSYVGSFKVHNGSTQKVSYKSNVHNARCQAHDHDNRHIETRNFNFDHQHNFSWNVGHH